MRRPKPSREARFVAPLFRHVRRCVLARERSREIVRQVEHRHVGGAVGAMMARVLREQFEQLGCIVGIHLSSFVGGESV
jgi:hypothetical protein